MHSPSPYRFADIKKQTTDCYECLWMRFLTCSHKNRVRPRLQSAREAGVPAFALLTKMRLTDADHVAFIDSCWGDCCVRGTPADVRSIHVGAVLC